jgi:hypothetical protein
MGIMAKNCCTNEEKNICARGVMHTNVERFQQWRCWDGEKSVVRLVGIHGLESMERVPKEDNVFVVADAGGLLFGKTESTKSCASGSGLSVGSLRATACGKSPLRAATVCAQFDGSSSIGLNVLLAEKSNWLLIDIFFWMGPLSMGVKGSLP